VLLAGGYRHRSMLPTLERDWAIRPRSVSPEGGWTGFSNPGTFAIFSGTGVPLAPAAGGALLDPACTVLGGTAVPTCTFQYTAYDNLVEEENNYHAYGEYNVELTDNLKLHVEANWGMHDVPEEHGSPSYGPNQGPSGGAPNYIIPLANPGLQALLPFLSSGQQALVNASRIGGQPSILVSGLQWRPFAQGGNPLTGGPQLNSRKFDAFRGSFNLSGEVADAFNWTAGATYMENGSVISTPDFLVSRLQLALQGLGGPNCTGTTPGANGCLWLNPFSTAIPNNPALGLTNTLTYTPTTANSPALISWFTAPNSYEATTKLLAVDAVLNGELSALALPGGNVGWAFGLQYRENSFERVITDDFANLLVTPCPQTPVNPAATCTTATTAPSGALSFYFPLVPTDVKQKVSSAFVEFNLPIVDKLNAQLAVRHENYSDGVGSTTNPKLSLRYQPIDSLTFRASGGTTFRAPPQTSLSGSTTFLFFTPQAGGYKPVDTFGNAKLKPETADTLNVGMIVKLAGFTGSVDYWHFTFKDALTTEIGTQLVTAMYSSYVDGLGVTQLDHCNDPAYAALLARFTFTSVGCRNPGYNPAIGATTGANAQAATLLRTRVNQINAQTDTTVSGIDASLAYVFDGVLGGALTLGAEGTYNLEYQLGANYVEGVLIDPATDAIGTRGGRAGSLPQWKGSAFVDLGTGAHNIRLTSRSVASMDEKYRPATFAVNTGGQHIGGFTTYDLTYRLQVMGDTTVSASVINLTDKDPPFARLDLNYDPFIANPLGRYFKVGVGTKF
jgi:iron complex outermembrane receptor protein